MKSVFVLTALHPERVRSLLSGGMGWLPEGSASVNKFATDTAESPRLQASLVD